MNPYSSLSSATDYLKFLNSRNGQLQQKFLSEAILEVLSTDAKQRVLDAACGSGWLSKILAEQGFILKGCDNSSALVEYARNSQPQGQFEIADISRQLPYPPQTFDHVIFNMAATDLAHLQAGYANLFDCLKPGGTLIVTIPNPYYAYPVGVWKHTLITRLLRRKPILKLRALPYNSKELLPSWDPNNPTSHYYSLSDHIYPITQAGFSLKQIKEIRSKEDSDSFDLQYQLYRFPLLLLLEFTKPVE